MAAVTCIDYAPTGLEFVTGSYDKTIRIFESHQVFIFLMVIINLKLTILYLSKNLGTFKRNLSY